MILNIFSTIIFLKKFTFLSFFFFDVQLNWLNLKEIFSFFIIYDFSEILKNWLFFSFLIYYYFFINYIFFNITFRSSLYKVENTQAFLIFFKFNCIFLFSQFIFKNIFCWFIYTFEENFTKYYFKIELTSLNIETIFFTYMIVCLVLLIFISTFFLSNISKKYKIIFLNLLLIFFVFIDIIFLENLYFFIFKLILFFFLRYVIFFLTIERLSNIMVM